MKKALVVLQLLLWLAATTSGDSLFNQTRDSTSSMAQRKRLAVWVGGRMGCAARQLAPQLANYRAEHPGHEVDLYVATDVHFYRRDFESNPDLTPTGVHLQSVPFGDFMNEDPFCLKDRGFCERVVKMHAFNHRAHNMIETSRVSYDVVMKFRPDVGQTRLPEIRWSELNDNTIFVPENWDWGPPERNLNDQVAYGTTAAMKKYSSPFLDLHNWWRRDQETMEPERSVRHNVNLTGLSVVRFPYAYELVLDRKTTPEGCGF